MTATDLHVETNVQVAGEVHDVFVCRFAFECKCDHSSFSHSSFEANIARIVEKYQAAAVLVFSNGLRVELSAEPSQRAALRRVVRDSGNLRMGVLVSNKDHCMMDLINRLHLVAEGLRRTLLNAVTLLA